MIFFRMKQEKPPIDSIKAELKKRIRIQEAAALTLVCFSCIRTLVDQFPNIVEQDHRFIKKRVSSMLGFKSYKIATYIWSGIEAMHMIKKGKFIKE